MTYDLSFLATLNRTLSETVSIGNKSKLELHGSRSVEIQLAFNR